MIGRYQLNPFIVILSLVSFSVQPRHEQPSVGQERVLHKEPSVAGIPIHLQTFRGPWTPGTVGLSATQPCHWRRMVGETRVLRRVL